MAMSHADHTHPNTRAARAACRKIRQVMEAGTAFAPAFTRPRQKPAAAPRIQPRRGGARVPARSSTCVQAALHIDAHGGSCACGWEAVA